MMTEEVTTKKKGIKISKIIIPIVSVLALVGIVGGIAVKFVIGDGTEYNYVEDTAVYGLQGGNTMYGQKVQLSEDGSKYITYNSEGNFASFVGNLETGESIRQRELYLYDVNIVGDTAYALEGPFYREGTRIISYPLTNPEDKTVIREKFDSQNYTMSAKRLLVVDDILYFIDMGEDEKFDTDDKFACLNMTTGEEKIIEAPLFSEYFIDNDTVYFINKEDDKKLYSMSVEGGEPTKLTNFYTYYAFMYEGRIYYIGKLSDFDILMSMNPDGTDHKMHKHIEFNIHAAGFSDGKLYTYDGGNICSIDVTDGKFTEHKIPVKEKIIEIMQTYYADYYERKLDGATVTEADKNCTVTILTDFSVSNGYVCFSPECEIGHVMLREAFLCDLETGEVTLLNEYFGTGSEMLGITDLE